MSIILDIYAAHPGQVTFRTNGDRPETVDRADLAHALDWFIQYGVARLGHSTVDESDIAALVTAMDEAS